MNKGLRFLLQGVVIALLGFGSWKSYELYQQHKIVKNERKKTALLEEKPFVVIIPSYNNSPYCEKNVSSVLTQNYKNFRVIYIDDASNDDTGLKVEKIVAASPLKEKVCIIHNEQNKGALANLYDAIHTCKKEEIIVTVDGDDFLAHEQVLTKLNKVYSTTPTWMTYGNFLNYPSYTQKPVACKPFPKTVIFNNSFRTHEWVSSHLRTFYAGLFQLVHKEDLLYQGKFLPMGWDLAMMLPMLEMSGKHTYFIHDILYLYNRTNPLNDHKVNLSLQSACADHVKNLPKYKRIKALPFETTSKEHSL